MLAHWICVQASWRLCNLCSSYAAAGQKWNLCTYKIVCVHYLSFFCCCLSPISREWGLLLCKKLFAIIHAHLLWFSLDMASAKVTVKSLSIMYTIHELRHISHTSGCWMVSCGLCHLARCVSPLNSVITICAMLSFSLYFFFQTIRWCMFLHMNGHRSLDQQQMEIGHPIDDDNN